MLTTIASWVLRATTISTGSVSLAFCSQWTTCGEHYDQARRAPPDQHGGDDQRRHACVDVQPVTVAEGLGEDQRGQQRHRDQVEDPAHPWAELPAAREDR